MHLPLLCIYKFIHQLRYVNLANSHNEVPGPALRHTYRLDWLRPGGSSGRVNFTGAGTAQSVPRYQYESEVLAMSRIFSARRLRNVLPPSRPHFAGNLDDSALSQRLVHHQRVHEALSRMPKCSRQAADDLEAERLPETHRALIG